MAPPATPSTAATATRSAYAIGGSTRGASGKRSARNVATRSAGARWGGGKRVRTEYASIRTCAALVAGVRAPPPQTGPRASSRSRRRPRSCPRQPGGGQSAARSLDSRPDHIVGQRGQLLLRLGYTAACPLCQCHRRRHRFDFEPALPLPDLNDTAVVEAKTHAQGFRDDNPSGRINGRAHGIVIPPRTALNLGAMKSLACPRARPSFSGPPSPLDVGRRGPQNRPNTNLLWLIRGTRLPSSSAPGPRAISTLAIERWSCSTGSSGVARPCICAASARATVCSPPRSFTRPTFVSMVSVRRAGKTAPTFLPSRRR